ncbi:class I SAM-dependent methyltransferase, partial [Frankia sp. Cpl3]|nr:class I SAM-dependent methyltransferase [Frankia sp. Cpl3]
MAANNMYSWAEYYDLTQSGLSGDIPFFLEMARQADGEILDLACGTGRISIPLAEAGHQVTGLDLSTEMLARAEQKAKERGVLDRL